jgi:hypothetical protein
LVWWFFGGQHQAGREFKTQEGTWRTGGGEMVLAYELRFLRCTVNTNRKLAVKWISLCYHGSIKLVTWKFIAISHRTYVGWSFLYTGLWAGFSISRRLRLSEFQWQAAVEGGKFVGLTPRPFYPVRRYPWFSLLSEVDLTRVPSCGRNIKSLKSLSDPQPSDMIYLLTAIGLTPGGSSTVHIYTQTIHRTTEKNNT